MNNENTGKFCGSVLLSENIWNKDQLISDLKADWEIDIPKEDTKGEDTIVTDIGKLRIVISKFPIPVPNEEAEINAENNYLWPEAVEVTKSHKAHIVVAVLGDEEDAIVKGLIYTKIMATCCKQKNAIGVFTSGVVFEPDYYTKFAEFMKQGALPIFNWIWVGLYPATKGVSAYTYGMDVFGKYELEILDVEDAPENLLAFMSSISSYILENDVQLKDGETIGFSENDIHEIRLSQGVALPDQDTLKISYKAKKKKSWWKKYI